MYRWAACPGSVNLSKGIHAPTSRYAAEGTCAHELADVCIRLGTDPDMYLRAKRTAENMDFIIDDEMVEAVRLYIDAGKEVFDPAAGDLMHTERKFDLSSLYPGLYGTNDRIIWKPAQRRLIVDDFKYGAGVPVEVKGNKQLRYYGLGAVLNLKLPVMEIWLRIIQPRCPHPDGPVRTEVMNALDLLDFQGELIVAAKATKDPAAPLNPGDHCKFCPAAGVCPALAKSAQTAAALAFDVVPKEGSAEPKAGIDYTKLAEALKLAPIVESWATAVRELAYSEAEAGKVIPGFKLVEKRANRQWRDIAKAEMALKEIGLGETQMYPEPVLRSPAQIEKVLGKKEFALIEPDLVEKVSSGHALAPDSDKRPAVTKQTAADAFANV